MQRKVPDELKIKAATKRKTTQKTDGMDEEKFEGLKYDYRTSS